MNRFSEEFQVLLKKFRILKRKQRECLYCGKKFKSSARSTIDHIVPLHLTKGAGHRIENLAKVCWKCNNEKGCSNPIEWLKSKRYLNKNLKNIIENIYKILGD